MAPLKVYGSSMSPAVRRVLACLYEKNLDFESVPVDFSVGENKKEPYRSLNPFGQIPAFEDGDIKMFESRAITNYIARAYADKGTQLTYSSGKQLAEVLVWTEVEAHQFDPVVSKLMREQLIKPQRLNLPADPAVVEEHEAKLNKLLDVYEARLSKSKYLAGESFSLADLHHLPMFGYLMLIPAGKLVDSRPHVSAWLADISARPAWIKAST